MGILLNLVTRRLLLITTLQNVEMFALKYRLIFASVIIIVQTTVGITSAG